MKRFILIAIIALAFFACGKDDPAPKKCECETKAHLEAGETCSCGGEDCNCTEKPEQPTARTATLTNLFNNGLTATVEGTLTDADWFTGNNKTVADDIQTAIETAFNNSIPPVKNGVFGFAFKDNDVVIIAEKNPGYDYKVDNTKKIRLNIKALSTINFEEAITALRDYQ